MIAVGLSLFSRAVAGLGVIDTYALRQRDSSLIYDRSGASITVRI